jgi:hypothetical protein
VNVFRDDWDDGEDWSGGGGRSKRLVEPGVALGASVYELGPGNFNVYHFHHGSEELLIVLRGRPTLRTPEGERQLAEGEVYGLWRYERPLRLSPYTPCAACVAGVTRMSVFRRIVGVHIVRR